MSKCECRDCINYNACEEWDKRYNGSNSGFPYECEEDTEACPFFKDKSLFVEFPCKDNIQKAISEEWKRTSRQIAELKKEILKNDEILELKKDIYYKDYQDLLQTNALKKEELKKLQIEINIWDIAREIVLNGGTK